MPPDFSIENSVPGPVCGTDEAGRGPWAGPVIAAAVILDPDNIPDGLDDSKKLTAKRREALFGILSDCCEIGIGQASVAEIGQLNILHASMLAMERAVRELPRAPALALVDGNRTPSGLDCPSQAIVGGDARSLSIAAASIIAKVTRDRLMVALSQQFPGYGWERNAGYGTRAHREGLEMYGVTQHHRRGFRPIRDMLCKTPH